MDAGSGEKLIGRITHYFSRLSVCSIELTDGELKVGDTIHISGKHTDFMSDGGFYADRTPEHQQSREGKGHWGQGQGKSKTTRSGDFEYNTL